MEEILLKDKVVYITPHTYEIKRLNGKWFRSFFQIDVINHVYIIDFMLAWMIVLFSLLQIKTVFFHLSGLFGGFLFSLVLSFLKYYQPISIPVGGVRKTYVNNNNQLVIDYIRKKRKLSKAVNLPAETSEREKAIHELQEAGVVTQSGVPYPLRDETTRVRKTGTYTTVVNTFVNIAFYIVLFHVVADGQVLGVSSSSFLFCVFTGIFSVYNLYKRVKAVV